MGLFFENKNSNVGGIRITAPMAKTGPKNSNGGYNNNCGMA
jgi:hypothetical protein